MENPPSPLDTLRQLKEMLDAGALTPTEFEALKQRLVFSEPAPMPTAPVVPFTEVPIAATTPPAISAEAAPEAQAATPVVAQAVEAGPPILPPMAQPEPLPELVASWPAAEFPAAETEVAPPARSSPLALILSIGAVLAFLALVLYLNLNQPPSEHISSTSQTAADSLAAAVETGPQAAPMPQVASAVPETVRVAPAHPAPTTPVRVRPTPTMSDSDYVAPAPAATDSVARQ